MNATRIHCPYCRSPHRQIRWGRTSAGSRKYRCHACKRVYTPAPRSNGYPPHVRQAAVQMHQNGVRCRRIGRLLGVHHQSVVNWVNHHRRQLTTTIPKTPPIKTAGFAAPDTRVRLTRATSTSAQTEVS